MLSELCIRRSSRHENCYCLLVSITRSFLLVFQLLGNMRDDYETGLQRGRSSRTVLGRVRWFLLVLLLVNFFLIYKVWDQGSELSDLRTRTSDMQKNVVSCNLKQARTDKQFLDLKTEKLECDKMLSTSKALADDQRFSNEECQKQLIVTSDKTKEVTARLEQLLKEKESFDAKEETCESDLKASVELVAQLRRDLASTREYENYVEKNKKEIIYEDTDEEDVANEKIPRNVDSVKNGTIIDKVKPVLNSISDNKIQNVEVKTPEEDEEVEDFDETKLDTLAQCQFNLGEDARQNLCNYKVDTSSEGRWQRGHSNIINDQIEFDHDQKDVIYLYVDHTTVNPGTPAGIIFSTIKSKQCIKVDITVLSVDTGLLLIEDIDNGQAFEHHHEQEDDNQPRNLGWKKASFLFKKSPSYTIKLTGRTKFKGAIAVADFFVAEAKCEEVNVIRKDDETEEEKRILIEEERQDKEAIKELIK